MASTVTMNDLKPDFHLPTEVYIQQDMAGAVPDIIKKIGKRAFFLMTTNDFEQFSEKIEKISDSLKNADVGCIVYDELPSNPNTEDIDEAVSFAKKTNCDLVIGFGGLESINSAKAVSLLVNNYIFCHDLFENTEPLSPALPYVSMPAYPIYGFEIAPIFFIEEIQDLSKKVYRNHQLYPRATLVDPETSTMIDDNRAMKTSICTLALSSESIISRNNNDIINTFALKSIDLIFRNLPLSYRDPKNLTPRRYLSAASVMSGIAFSTAYLSASLAIALALSSKTDLDIESAISVILPHIMEFNLTSSPGKYVQMSKVMGEDVREITVIEAAIKSVEAIRKLETDMEIPQRLSGYNISKAIYKDVADIAAGYPFIGNAPRELTPSEIETILIAAY